MKDRVYADKSQTLGQFKANIRLSRYWWKCAGKYRKKKKKNIKNLGTENAIFNFNFKFTTEIISTYLEK